MQNRLYKVTAAPVQPNRRVFSAPLLQGCKMMRDAGYSDELVSAASSALFDNMLRAARTLDR